MRQMRMKDQSDKYNLSTEIIAAYLDGNATPAEVQLVFDAMAHDAHLRELLLVSSHVDTELALLHRKPEYIPMTALAAECGEDNLCCLECEKYVMKGRGITYDEQQMLEDALCNGWLKQEGTALHNVGRHLEKTGLVVTRQYGCSIQNIIDALNHHEDVIVAVDSGKLLPNKNINHLDNADTQFLPDHTVVVIAGDVETDVITLFDPNSPNPTDTYSLAQFASAWADSKNYLVTIKTFDNSRNATLTMELFKNNEDKIYNIFASISEQGHDCREHTCEHAWHFMNEFSRIDGKIIGGDKEKIIEKMKYVR